MKKMMILLAGLVMAACEKPMIGSENNDVPVTRNRITTYTGKFFEPGDGIFTQSDFGFVVHSDWDGESTFDF